MTYGKDITRVAVQVTALVLAACVAGCGEPGSLEPPGLVQLACEPDNSRDSMTLLLDTARRTASWADVGAPATGKLEIAPLQYRLDVPATKESQAFKAVINRYDGRLSLIWSAPPQPTVAVFAPGPDSRVWRCKKAKTGPIL